MRAGQDEREMMERARARRAKHKANDDPAKIIRGIIRDLANGDQRR